VKCTSYYDTRWATPESNISTNRVDCMYSVILLPLILNDVCGLIDVVAHYNDPDLYVLYPLSSVLS
jgi:hypothetical protein